MTNKRLCVAACLILALCTAPAMAAEIAQGKCITYEGGKQLTIEEYDVKDKPTGKNTTFETASAVVGIAPKAGDVVRIAYKEESGKKVAVRIMNVSKQDLMKK